MKTGDVRGMRHIPTIQGERNRTVPNSREQAMTEMARLEHERARLEREVRTWQVNQMKTEERLGHVMDRLRLLEQMLHQDDAVGAGKPTTGGRSPSKREDNGGAGTSSWREMKLEY